MGERILTILLKEFRSVFRDPRMRMVIFGVPVIQTLIFGYAVTMDVRHVRLAIIDRDQTPASRALVARFAGSDYFQIVARTTDGNRAAAMIDAADASAALQIDAGFADNLRGGRTTPVQLIVDGADSNTARMVLTYATTIASAYNSEIMLDQALRRTGRTLFRRRRRPPPPRVVQ